MYSRTAIARCVFWRLQANCSISIPKDIGDGSQTNFRPVAIANVADSATVHVGKMPVLGSCRGRVGIDSAVVCRMVDCIVLLLVVRMLV